MRGRTLAKYLLAFSGLGIVLLSDRFGMPRLGYAGLALIVAAFALRFVQRRREAGATTAPPPDGR